MKVVVRVKNLRLRTFIGIFDFEKKNKQDVILNLALHLDECPGIKSDKIEDTMDYKTLTKRCIELVENNRFELIEKLAGDLMTIALDFPRVRKARVEVDKPHALRFSDSVSVVLEEQRPAPKG